MAASGLRQPELNPELCLARAARRPLHKPALSESADAARRIMRAGPPKQPECRGPEAASERHSPPTPAPQWQRPMPEAGPAPAVAGPERQLDRQAATRTVAPADSDTADAGRRAAGPPRASLPRALGCRPPTSAASADDARWRDSMIPAQVLDVLFGPSRGCQTQS